MTASPLPSSVLLDFDQLVKLAKQDPQALEALRQQACEQLIASASLEDQRKLKGLQFKIDMQRRRAKSTNATCVYLAEMMNQSFTQLKALLSHTQERLPHRQATLQTQSNPTAAEEITSAKNNIFPFPAH